MWVWVCVPVCVFRWLCRWMFVQHCRQLCIVCPEPKSMQSSPALPWLVPSRVRHSLCGSCQRRQAPLPGPSEYLTCVTTHTDTHGHACDVRRSLWHLGVTKQVAKNSMSRRGHLVFIHLLQRPLPPSLSIYLSQGSSSTHHPLRIRGVGPG